MKKSIRNERILKVVKNRYFLTALGFLTWMTFFDQNNFITRYSYHKDLQKLEEEREYYIQELDQTKQKQHYLMSNPGNLEKFAREEYLMKKENEDIFLILKNRS